jgi:ABC-2 type transport system permease protein
MTPFQLWTSYYTMLRKDVVRMFRIWAQTFLPNIVTSTLYFLIFGSVLGSKIGLINGIDYMTFVVPGLVMLAVVTSSYANTSFTFFQSKFFAKSIEELLVSPTPPWLIVAGYVSGGVIRGVLVGLVVLLVSLFFTPLILSISSIAIVLLFGILTATIFSLAGLVNAVYAKSFDTINIVPTFVLTPLVYLGGVFYSASSLPPLAQTIMHFNPIFYLINGFRYGFLGITDVAISTCLVVLVAIVTTLALICTYLIRTGLGLKQ